MTNKTSCRVAGGTGYLYGFLRACCGAVVMATPLPPKPISGCLSCRVPWFLLNELESGTVLCTSYFDAFCMTNRLWWSRLKRILHYFLFGRILSYLNLLTSLNSKFEVVCWKHWSLLIEIRKVPKIEVRCFSAVFLKAWITDVGIKKFLLILEYHNIIKHSSASNILIGSTVVAYGAYWNKFLW